MRNLWKRAENIRRCGICSSKAAAAWGEVTRLFACLGRFAGEKGFLGGNNNEKTGGIEVIFF